jgi:hypothetical protein
MGVTAGGSGGARYGTGGPGGWGGDAVEAGIRAAADRMARHGLDMPRAEIADPLAAATNLLRERPQPLPDRAVELWMETVAVAASARVLYREPPMQEDEMRSFLDSWTRLINSWGHPPP